MPAPQFGGVGAAGYGTSTSPSATAPSGVTSGDYQLCVVEIASGSAALGATPSGWSLLLDVNVTGPSNPDRGGSNRFAVYESTTVTGTFNLSISSSRVWHAVRAFWTLPQGSAGRTRAPASTVVSSSGATSVATPPVTTGEDNSLAICAGGFDTGPASNTVSWSDTGGYTPRYNANIGSGGGTADGTVERQCVLICDQVIDIAESVVTGTLSLSGTEEPAVLQVVLDGVADAVAGPEPGRMLLGAV